MVVKVRAKTTMCCVALGACDGALLLPVPSPSCRLVTWPAEPFGRGTILRQKGLAGSFRMPLPTLHRPRQRLGPVV